MTNSRLTAVRAAGLAGLFLSVLTGCGDDGLSRVAVKGNVMVDGQPLKSGSITFIPTEGTEGPKASGQVVDGAYELNKNDGPMIGKLRVEIHADQKLGYELDDPEDFDAKAPRVLPKNPIPPQFNDRSTLVRETKEGETNEFDFEIKTKQ